MFEDRLENSMQILLEIDVHLWFFEGLFDNLSENLVLLWLLAGFNVKIEFLDYNRVFPARALECQSGAVHHE